MNNLLLRMYHRLPAPARSAAATLRGAYLDWWRYGPETERLVAEAHEREQWSAAQWAAWRDERLAYVLQRAATTVPYYREQWLARRRGGDRASVEVLANWPVLEKEPLRRHPRAFVTEDCDVRRMQSEQTSGTTGTPLRVWRSRRTLQASYALSAARVRRWYGVPALARRASVGGQLVVPVQQRHPPLWVWNAGQRQLYLSSYHLAPDLIPHYLDALERYRVVYLSGYTSSLYALAQEALRLGWRTQQLLVTVTSAEPVAEYQREAIQQAFQCPVCETYGMVELVAAASECASGRLHLWPELGWLEVLDGQEPVANGTIGDLVGTSLLDLDMPLIRYRVGDRGALPAAESACPCGRSLPTLAGVEGRIDDVLYTRDGRRIGRLSPVVKGLPVREAQIVQETLDRVRVRYVPTPGFGPEAALELVQRAQARLGPMEVVLEELHEVPRTSNGKFRAVICKLTPAERDAALLGR